MTLGTEVKCNWIRNLKVYVVWVYCSRWTSANGGWMQPFTLRRIALRLQFLRVNSVMAPNPRKLSSFLLLFLFKQYWFFFFFKLSFHLKGLYFRLTGCCSWRLSALCFLSRENEFLFIHLSYIATFLNRSSYKFCFQIVILVIKGEQNSMVRRTELRIHAFLTLLSIHMSSFRMEYSRYFSLPSFSTSFPYNLVCFAFQYSICFWVISPCGIFLNRYSLSENWDTESLQSQEWRYY